MAEKKTVSKSTYPFWAPRFWHGLRLGTWSQLVRHHRLRIHPKRWGLAATVTGLTVFNSTVGAYSRWRHRSQVEQTDLVAPPIFIVGHWRSGTTYLHELLSLDARFASPTTYQCFAANHFLSTAGWLPKLLWFLMPSQRPMDNVRTSWNSPQEDEFALCSLGVPSPYLRMAFPNDLEDYLEYLDLTGVPPHVSESWDQALTDFLKSLTIQCGKRLVLKSPTHTARVQRLAQLFPGARFLHITRNPLSIYPSTMNLWRVLDEAQGLQIPHHDQLHRYVMKAFTRMYDAFHVQRAELTPAQVYDIRYEDLVADPIGVLNQAYTALELEDFDAMRVKLDEELQANRRYQTNKFDLPVETRAEVMQAWSDYAQRYGYATS